MTTEITWIVIYSWEEKQTAAIANRNKIGKGLDKKQTLKMNSWKVPVS